MKRILFIFSGSILLTTVMVCGQPTKCSERETPCMALLNGRLHTYQYPATEGHPFFITKNWITGEIISEEGVCSEAQLRYDIFLDVMLFQFLSEGEPFVISLNPDEYDRILLAGHQFVPSAKVGVDLKYLSVLPTYIEVLYDNSLMLCGGYSKHLRKGSPGIPDEYIETVKFWLKKDNHLFPLKNRKNLTEALSDRKKEIRQFIRQNGIFRIDNSESLSRIIAYYESLKE